jgi:hypothetical protein
MNIDGRHIVSHVSMWDTGIRGVEYFLSIAKVIMSLRFVDDKQFFQNRKIKLKILFENFIFNIFKYKI